MASDRGTAAKPLHVPNGRERLPTGWSWGRLDDLCEGVFDCPHSTPKLVDAGPLVVRTQDIITGVFRTERAAHVSEETYRERTIRALPQRGDLLYSREGTYFGIAAEVPEKVRVCLGQRMVLIRPLASKLDFRCLRHWLNSPVMAAHIHGHRDGSVAERLNLPTIRALPVAVPPLAEQRAIAHILGTLDDKIELNRRANETLEAMARALFKAWFVDFEPVRAKLEGRWQHGQSLPGLPAHLYDLFPDRLVESELVEIPEGWEYVPLSRFIEIFDSRRVPLSSKQRAERQGIYPYHGATGVMDTVDDYLFDGIHVLLGEDGSVVQENGRPYTQYVWGKFWVNNHAHVLRGRGMTNETLLLFLEQCDVAPFVTGAVQPKLSQGNLKAIPFLSPGDALLSNFGQIVAAIFEQTRDLSEESRSLIQLRDTLLPKLISGELRIKDAEAFLKERVL